MCTGHFAVKVDDRDQMLLNLDMLGLPTPARQEVWTRHLGPRRTLSIRGAERTMANTTPAFTNGMGT